MVSVIRPDNISSALISFFKNPALVPHGSKTQELANSLYVIRPSLTHILARF